MGRTSVYYYMINGGIIEGNTEYSGFSDLSPATYFGSGETRMQMRVVSGGIKGPSEICATSLPILFMKYLAILATVVGAYAQDGSFNASVYSLNNGDIYVIDGTYVAPKPSVRDEIIANYRRMNEELSADIARSRQLSELRRQTDELRRQTDLLRQIANE